MALSFYKVKTVPIRADMKNSVLPLTCAIKYFPDEKKL